MGYITEIFEWEGDDTQPFEQFTWKTRLYNLDNRKRMGYGRIYFDIGDFADFNAAIDAYNEAINVNLQYLSAGRVLFEAGPHQGWPVGGLPVAGSLLSPVGNAPTYTGDRSLVLRVYVKEVLEKTIDVFNEKPFKLGVRKRDNRWEFELEGNVENVKRMEFAPSVEELKQPAQ